VRSGIQTRLLLVTTVVLGICLTLAGLVLDRSFQASVRAGAEEQLRLMIFSLMGTASDHEGHLDFTSELPEPRLGQPQSGLYATVLSTQGESYWRSPSHLGEDLNIPPPIYQLLPGQFRFGEVTLANLDAYYLSYAVIWEGSVDRELVFNVLVDRISYESSIASFRRNLYLGLLGVIGLFVLAQILAVRWGLRPLRTMTEEVAALERGDRERLSAAYPHELQGLASNLDRFVEHEKRNRSRYRKALEDLAHSLKTPLAVLHNGLRGISKDNSADASKLDLLSDQLERMESSVSYQLSRASVTGPVIIGRPVVIKNLLERLLRALSTAYMDRGIDVVLEVDESVRVRGDERDMLEIFGNLLENGFKYTGSKIRIRAQVDDWVRIIVEDDGPGIDASMREQVLTRGTRADQVQPGQGIGLSVVAELLELYRGEMQIGDSTLGGAHIELRFPL
jgi:two-component system sensor histidine kinase PhoQ